MKQNKEEIGRRKFLAQREQLASLRTEYDLICRYRLEWSRTCHNYGWVAIPASLTVPAILFGYVAEQPSNRIVLIAGFVAVWVLLLFWRVISHQIDKQIRLLYPRAIEIGEILDIQFTRIWLKDQWKLDHLPIKEDALARAAKRIDFSRGHMPLDLYSVGYFLVTLIVILALRHIGWFI